MTILRLLCAIVGTAALYVAGVRLAAAIPPLWGPLWLLCIVVSVAVLLGTFAGLAMEAFRDQLGKAWDWRRHRWYETVLRQRRVQQQSDRDIRALQAIIDERDIRIAELAKENNRLYPELKELREFRRNYGRRAEDKG